MPVNRAGRANGDARSTKWPGQQALAHHWKRGKGFFPKSFALVTDGTHVLERRETVPEAIHVSPNVTTGGPDGDGSKR